MALQDEQLKVIASVRLLIRADSPVGALMHQSRYSPAHIRKIPSERKLMEMEIAATKKASQVQLEKFESAHEADVQNEQSP